MTRLNGAAGELRLVGPADPQLREELRRCTALAQAARAELLLRTPRRRPAERDLSEVLTRLATVPSGQLAGVDPALRGLAAACLQDLEASLPRAASVGKGDEMPVVGLRQQILSVLHLLAAADARRPRLVSRRRRPR
ncbi:hypothetical protein JSY14_01185 [Brachybacterium sp. EF45031]|uniref:hypothetical protein n=1 Tax=Brachybacterium sillae TaxID=2810536 RepID=UPI00217DA14C|nr:hypothetical protein [Brachybacterium sillae]MCS6710699.1 hypothetical protein [Brachybacterium sillae]